MDAILSSFGKDSILLLRFLNCVFDEMPPVLFHKDPFHFIDMSDIKKISMEMNFEVYDLPCSFYEIINLDDGNYCLSEYIRINDGYMVFPEYITHEKRSMIFKGKIKMFQNSPFPKWNGKADRYYSGLKKSDFLLKGNKYGMDANEYEKNFRNGIVIYPLWNLRDEDVINLNHRKFDIAA